MSFVTYPEIEHLIDHAAVDGSRMHCYFKCPESGVVVEAHGSMPLNVANRVRKDAADSLIRQLFQLIARLIRQYTGLHFNFGASATAAGGMPNSFSEADQKAAVVAAFEKHAVYPGKPEEKNRFNHINGAWVYVK